MIKNVQTGTPTFVYFSCPLFKTEKELNTVIEDAKLALILYLHVFTQVSCKIYVNLSIHFPFAVIFFF